MRNLKVSVLSHRRSGTHLTIDSLINNFKIFDDYVSVEDLPKKNRKSVEKIESESVILKSHSEYNLNSYLQNEHLANLVRNSNIIYVFRDGRDVMASLYDYKNSHDKSMKGKSFSTFIREKNDYKCGVEYSGLSRVEYWCKHVSRWLASKEILFIKYQEWINNYMGTIEKIENYLDIRSLEETKDIRVQGRLKGLFKKYFGSNKMSSVHINKGKTGRYKNYFSESDLKYFEKKSSKYFNN